MQILGIKDAKGNPINPADIGKKKRYIPLHYTPKSIVENVNNMLTMAKEGGESQEVIDLFTDILVLLNWASERLPLATPPTK